MRYVLFLGAAAAAMSLVAAPAHAEDEEIVVTATRAPAPVSKLPAEVDVIDIAEAQARGDRTLAEALREAPGLGVVASGGPGQQASLFAGGSNSNDTLVLFDGLRINDPSTPGSSFDAGEDPLGGLRRIEVVQGPMSAVFGSDAIGGVVNLIPRHGGDGPLNGRLDAATGSFGTVTGSASADGTLGRFRYALTAEGFATDGYDLVPKRISTHTGERDGASISALTGVFDARVSDRIALDLLVRQRRAHADLDPFPFDPLTFTSFRGEDGNLEISRNDLSLGRLGATWDVSSALSLRATYGGMRQHRVQSDDGVGTDFYKGDRRFGDLTLTWNANDTLTLVGGVSSESDKVSIAEGFGFPSPSSFVNRDEDHDGAFVTAQSELGFVTFTGAARVDDYDAFGTHSTYRLGASFDIANLARVYGAYGTSFRAPTLYERFVSFGDPNLVPEEGKSWEIGADAHFGAFGDERGIELGVLYRRSDIADLINFGPSFTYANVDRAMIDTAQARFSAHPFDWLTLRVAYVYTDARDDISGTPLLRRPKDYWTADISVSQGPFRAFLSWREVGERSDQIYGDDGFSAGVGVAPSYAVSRVAAAYEFHRGAEIYLAADNVFDAAYEPANGFAGTPRNTTIGVRLRSAP